MSQAEQPVVIRAATGDEDGFVRASWKRGFRSSCSELPGYAYWDWQSARIDRVLARGATVLVAFDADNPAVAVGWLCAERMGADFVLHWTYAKSGYRRMRVASQLLAEAVRQLGKGATRLVRSHAEHPRLTATAEAYEFVYVPLKQLEVRAAMSASEAA